MIVITGTIPTRPEKRDAAIAAMVIMQEASLAEPGCNKYQFGFASQDPALAMIVEEWVDQAALDAHFATPHMATSVSRCAMLSPARGPSPATKCQAADRSAPEDFRS